MARAFLTTSSAARVLHVADGTVRQMARRGELPAIRTEGGVRLFDPADVDRVARERAARALTPAAPEEA